MNKLICFDMDSTLIDCEFLEEMADTQELKDKLNEITDSAMNGKINYKESLIERVALLKDYDIDKLKRLSKNLPLMKGSKELVSRLKNNGYITCIITGGPDIVANIVAKRIGIDFACSNHFFQKKGKLTGEVDCKIINKSKILTELKKQFNTDFVVAIGDGANDLEILKTASLGIGFNAKPIVKEQIQTIIEEKDLMKIWKIISNKS